MKPRQSKIRADTKREQEWRVGSVPVIHDPHRCAAPRSGLFDAVGEMPAEQGDQEYRDNKNRRGIEACGQTREKQCALPPCQERTAPKAICACDAQEHKNAVPKDEPRRGVECGLTKQVHMKANA